MEAEPASPAAPAAPAPEGDSLWEVWGALRSRTTVGAGVPQKPRTAAVAGAERHTAEDKRGTVGGRVARCGGDPHENVPWVTVRVGGGAEWTEE